LETVGGERILDRLARVMTAALGQPPLLVANAPDASEWRPDLRTVSDVRPGFGALGGIYTAVIEAPAPVVCVAWDMPFVSESLIQALAEGLDGADAVLPQSDGRRGVEPLCAAYGSACREAIAASLAEDDLRAIGFHHRIRVGARDDVTDRGREPGDVILRRDVTDARERIRRPRISKIDQRQVVPSAASASAVRLPIP